LSFRARQEQFAGELLLSRGTLPFVDEEQIPQDQSPSE